MKKSIAVLFTGLAIAALALSAACTHGRTHRLTDFQYTAKPAGAPIDVFVAKVTQPYEAIAIVDSKIYSQKDEASKKKMLEDVKREGNAIGADAVQNVRVLAVKSHGLKADKDVPLPGAFKQGDYNRYFLRGEAVKYVSAGATTATLGSAPTPSPEPEAQPIPTPTAK